MDGVQWEKLRLNFTQIVEDVDIFDVLSFFVEKDILEPGCLGEYHAIPTDRQRMDKFLEVMKRLPAEKKAFDFFLAALRASSLPYDRELADKIESTQTKSDPSVRSKEDPLYYEPIVRKILSENFANKKGRFVDITEIRQVLDEKKAFYQISWSNKWLAEFVCKVFVGIEVSKKRIGPKRLIDCFGNLDRIFPNHPQSQSEVASANAMPAEDVSLDVSTLSSSQLKSFLQKEFEEVGLSSDPLNELELGGIDGKSLLLLEEDQLLQVMPSSKIFHRQVVNELIRKHEPKKASAAQNEVLTFRQFDKDVKSTDVYMEGQIANTSIQTRAKTTIPIRNFHLPEFTSKNDMRNYILGESAIFAAACINERRNGTIYFGISPKDFQGRKKGQIVGLHLSPEGIDDCIPSLFFPRQCDVIKECVRNFKFVPVVRKQDSATLYVIELDVMPGSFLKTDDCIKINTKSIPRLHKKWDLRDPVFKFSASGKPELMPPNETCDNTKVSPTAIDRRKCDEQTVSNKFARNLVLKLRNHITGGLDKKEDDIHTFLFLSPINSSSVNLDNFQFIKHLQPDVVFDFAPRCNPESDLDGIYNALEDKQEEVMRVVTLNDFDEEQRDKMDMKTFQTELVECKCTNWVFCNGYGQMEELGAVQWNKKRSHAFHAAFRHYLKMCSKDQVLLIICLFSPSSPVFVEACHDILRELPEQWILLSHDDSIVATWQKTVILRNIVDKSDLEDRCIVGLPWEQVDKCITDWCGGGDSYECHIPHSCGGAVTVESKNINEWSDVEVLSTLDPIHPDDDGETIRMKQNQAEEDFYRGGQVQWLNFFSYHVCLREFHEDLYGLVLNALEEEKGEEDDKVMTVYLYHEPGAGGSTSARQILWSLRKKYRCCLVRHITDQTVSQLTEIFFHKDKSPAPILILLDNEDENELLMFKKALVGETRTGRITGIFCVLLICSRNRAVSVPLKNRGLAMVTLRQILGEREIQWFNNKYDSLKSRSENPRPLISLDILKEGFDKEKIKIMVKAVVKQITNSKEITILKYVSLINTFDLDFRCIPVTCFDFILDTGFISGNRKKRKTNWGDNVSCSFKDLLNLSSRVSKPKKPRKTIRVVNKQVAGPILQCIQEKTEESVSDILSSLLTHKIFYEINEDMLKFQQIISNMVKKRGSKEEKLEKFSPIVLDIMENEGVEKAGQMMEQLFELNNDPYTAQQIARYYIENKNYEKAKEFAELATTKRPQNSYMWDTYAHVFRAQLVDKVQEACKNVDGEVSNSELQEIIVLCQKCSDGFLKEQSVNEREALNGTEDVNLACHFGQLRAILLLLNAMQKCKAFRSKKVTHRFLIDERYTNERLSFLSKDEVCYLKQLWKSSKETIRRLDEEFLQTKVEIEANPFLSSHVDGKKELLKLRLILSDYFGESCDEVPADLSEEDKCLYRWRVAFSKKAISLSDTLARNRSCDFGVLEQCHTMMLENVRSRHSTLDDLKSLLDIVTALAVEGRESSSFEDVIHWSKELYRRSMQKNEGYCVMEVFLYFVLYNFPTEERLKFPSLALSRELISVLRIWRDTYNSTRNLERISSKATTLFFLGRGQPLKDIVYQKQLNEMMYGSENHFKWQLPEVGRLLKVMSGILSDAGDEISYSYKDQEGNKNWIEVKTCYKIVKRAWYQKRIYFYLGFSFSGLMAYGMTDKAPVAEDRLESAEQPQEETDDWTTVVTRSGKSKR